MIESDADIELGTAAAMAPFDNGGLNADGLYDITTSNFDGRFDWYKIGGQWDGWLNHKNIITANRLATGPKLKTHLPYFVLNPDGVWIQREQLYVVGTDVKRKTIPEQDWLTKVRQQLRRWPEYQVVCVDAHC